MGKFESFVSIKEAIDGETYYDTINVSVTHDNVTYVYKNIHVKIFYDPSYAQMKVEVFWEDDLSQPDYSSINLHGTYNTNFQEFVFSKGILKWMDNENTIEIKFK